MHKMNLWRKEQLKVEGQRQVIDTGADRLLVIRVLGDPLHITTVEGGDAELTVEHDDEAAIGTRSWIWSNGRSRVTVKEYTP